MKASVSVALVICGTVLIVTPYISSGIGTAQVTRMIAQLGRDVSLRGGMPSWYDGGCFVVGLLMALVGVAGSLRGGSSGHGA